MLKNEFNLFHGGRSIRFITAIVLFVFLLASSGIVSALDDKNPDSEMTNVEKAAEFIAQQEALRKATFTSGIDVENLSVVKNNPNVIDARGQISVVEAEIPITYTELRGQELFERYHQIGTNTIDEIVEKYGYPDGPVIGQGFDFNGYLTVSFLTGSEIDNDTLNSIYDILDKEAIKVGIENVPVVFEYEEIPHEDIEETDAEETDVEISTDGPENENTNTTPGFSALTLIIMIFLLWRFKSN